MLRTFIRLDEFVTAEINRVRLGLLHLNLGLKSSQGWATEQLGFIRECSLVYRCAPIALGFKSWCHLHC